MTAAVKTNGTPSYRSALPSPSTEIVTLASPSSPVPVSDFEDVFMLSPINYSEVETETEINAAPVSLPFEVPLGPLSGYGGAPKPAPKYKNPVAQLTKPVTEQPDYAYLFDGYDADALVFTDQQINSLGLAVDSNEQHYADPTGPSSPVYGEIDSNDSDPFIYDHISNIPNSCDYYNALDEGDHYNASDKGESPSDDNSFEYRSAFDSDYDDGTFEVHDADNDDVGSMPDSEPPSPFPTSSELYSDNEADSEDNDDDDDDEEEEEEEEKDNNDDEDELTDNNNFDYSDDNESGDSSERCSDLDSHPLYLPSPIYVVAMHLAYNQSPPMAPDMLPPAPPSTPIAVPSNAPSNIPRNSGLDTLDTLKPISAA